MHESIAPSFSRPACIAHTVAMLLHGYWAIYDPPSTSLLYATHHTTLVITTSCKGQSESRLLWRAFEEVPAGLGFTPNRYIYICTITETLCGSDIIVCVCSVWVPCGALPSQGGSPAGPSPLCGCGSPAGSSPPVFPVPPR